jgi:hypothetical protein
MQSKTDDLLDLIIKIANDQGLCNLPYSKVMIYYGENEDSATQENYTFKIMGGEEMPEED